MMTILKMTTISIAVLSVTACTSDGLRRYSGPNDYIAVASDLGRDSNSNRNDNAAIAITPDGCHQWYIDDGVESRGSSRLDPVSGLPVCGGGTPGVVYGAYQSGTQGIMDYVPGEPVPVQAEVDIPIRSIAGHGHVVQQ